MSSVLRNCVPTDAPISSAIMGYNDDVGQGTSILLKRFFMVLNEVVMVVINVCEDEEFFKFKFL